MAYLTSNIIMHIKSALTYTIWNGAPSIDMKCLKQDKYKKLCEEILHETAQRHNLIIRELFVMPEHIHMSVEAPQA